MVGADITMWGLIKTFGLSVVALAAFIYLILSITKNLISTVVCQLESSRAEQVVLSKDFKNTVDNHIDTNTKAVNNLERVNQKILSYIENHDNSAEQRTQRIVDALNNLKN